MSLIGKLSFACKVARPGRIFLRRLINLSTSVKQLDHYIHIDKEAREDIKWWHDFIATWNGISIIPDQSGKKVYLFTDASSVGLGGFLGSSWFSSKWPQSHKDYHINIKELLAVLAAVFSWSKSLKNKHVVLFTDNLDIVQIWTSGSSKNADIMKLIRALFLFCAKQNIILSLRHIYGFVNIKADCLSRLSIQKFKKLHPSAETWPTPIDPLIWSV